MRKRWKKIALALFSIGVLGVALVLVLAWKCPLPVRLYQPGSKVVLFADGTPAYVFLSDDEKWRIPSAVDRVDPAYIQALLRLEDKRFYTHKGVDPWALMRALVLNIRKGRILSGGSTLTMQLARMMEPSPRSFGAKLRQMFRALQLEMRLSKHEILEAYLTFLPFGRNVEGIDAAALAYFGHPATALTPTEIATLLAVPQDPVHRYPSPQHAERLQRARDHILTKLYQAQAVPLPADLPLSHVLSQAVQTPVPQRLLPFPRQIPHMAAWLLQHAPRSMRYKTHLNAGMQQTTERMLEAHRDALQRQGIFNAVILVVEHASSKVQASVGNMDFLDKEHAGQVVGFDVPRSPGSTLKPLLYAQALDVGLILPDFLVPDAPVEFGSYQPHNYDKNYSGLVRMEDALSRSLNIPFVQLLNRFGTQRFLVSLKRMNAYGLHADLGQYGLSAMVGGMELTPLELVGFYATLARDGVHRPLQMFAADAGDAPIDQVLWSKAASYFTKMALSKKDRPDFPIRRSVTPFSSAIYWKTGTSFAHRDAWAIGSNATHTVLVWLGNFNNRSSSFLVGSDAAGPVLFDILEAIAAPWHPALPSDQLKTISVCAYSGYPAAPACPHKTQTQAIAAQLPLETCPYHVQWNIQKKTGRAVAAHCVAAGRTVPKTFLVYPPSVRRWFKEKGYPLSPLPTFVSGCVPTYAGKPPVMVFPAVGQMVILIPGLPLRNQMVALAADSARSANLHWFVDGRSLGTHPSEDRVYWEPSPGEHLISTVDDFGQSTQRSLKVQEEAVHQGALR